MGLFSTPTNTSRAYLEQFVARAAQSVPPGALVLDAGAGDSPYRGLFDHARYESADFCAVDKVYASVTYECDLAAIPAEDGRFHTVILTQVLEHLPEPRAVLRELHRILAPGGVLWLSAPLFYQEHEVPYDFYRYTQFGLRHLLESAGFEVRELSWLEGYYGTLAYQAESASRYLSPRPRVYGGGSGRYLLAIHSLLLRPVLRLAAGWFRWLDMRHKLTTTGYCKNYTAVAVKPEGLVPGAGSR